MVDDYLSKVYLIGCLIALRDAVALVIIDYGSSALHA
jgi:hypothetical protein